MLIVYKDIASPYVVTFIIGYVIFLLIYVLSLLIKVLINLRSFIWEQLRKKLFTFFMWFLFLNGSTFLINYFFIDSTFELWDLSIPLGLAFGIAFADLLFKSNKEITSD
ncbi:hypothetical protein [Bacillus sp. PS06]|uniref:hypothetical protein n=1 Tax=Bacillus sp. PS06 TaxID=2764176 RepID=UPI001782DAEC|nr:hypothetical protein [Bacillus sp. PS06]MBD8068607.1 hypothetical protein [Bacillus sp. PS06]